MLDGAPANDALSDIIPMPLPGADDLIPGFRHRFFHGFYDKAGSTTTVEPLIPPIMRLIITGNQALINDNLPPEVEKDTVHRAISKSGLQPDGAKDVEEVCLEIETAILTLRQAYRIRLAQRQAIETRLETVLDSTPESYELTKLLAGAYNNATPEALAAQGLHELLVCKLQPGKPTSKTIPEKLLDKTSSTEFDSLIVLDILTRNSTERDIDLGPTPHIDTMVGFSRLFAQNLSPSLANDEIAKNLLTISSEFWPKGAVDELELAKSALHTLLSRAHDSAVRSTNRQGWTEFSDDPSKEFAIARCKAVLALNSWRGWPYDMSATEKARYTGQMRKLIGTQQPQPKLKTTSKAKHPEEKESSPKNTITYADSEGTVFPVNGPKFMGHLVSRLNYKDIEQAEERFRPVLDFLRDFDFLNTTKSLQYLKLGRPLEDGRRICRLILGSTVGIATTKGSLNSIHLIFSLEQNSANETFVHIHSLATKDTYTVLADSIPKVLRSHKTTSQS